jgi:outer membrane protein assembly factor BamB
MNKPKNILSKMYLLIFLVVINASGCINIDTPEGMKFWPDTLVYHKIVQGDKALKNIWTRSAVFARNSSRPLMTADQNTVFITGSCTQTKPSAIIAFDGTTGNLRWENEPILATSLDASSSVVYVGVGNETIAYEAQTGEILWRKRLSGVRNVSHLYVIGNTIYAGTSPFYLMRADTGEIIKRFRLRPTKESLAKLEKQLPEFDPVPPLNPDYFLDNAFTQNVKFRQTLGLDYVRAIERTTDIDLWKKGNVISNVAATEAAVYLLTLQGELLGLEPQTGEVLNSVKFEPNPFLLSDPEGYGRGYYVAVDEDAGLLYAYLGDSNQLFAFKIVDYPEE